jgi:peptidoglycan/LPS O-acetylase OafA/YrhL
MLFAYTMIAWRVAIPGPVGHVADLLLLQAWFPESSIYAGGNGVTWSLSDEMFFYLLFPLAMVLLKRLRGRGLGVTAAVTLAAMLGIPLIVSLAGVSTYSPVYYWLFFVFPPLPVRRVPAGPGARPGDGPGLAYPGARPDEPARGAVLRAAAPRQRHR